MQASLNHAYRLVWSEAQQAFVAVSECTRGRGKGGASKKSRLSRSLLASALLLTGAICAHAQLPTGGEIVGGSGSISSSGNTLTVTQISDRMAANWHSFSIGPGNTVNFVQPSSSAVALNRVLGSDVSVIQGAINANGQIFLVNPNGVLFSPTAHVNVGSIVASTLKISTPDFMAGNYRFEGSSSNAVINLGNISAHGNGQGGGTVALIAARIQNTGSLSAHAGKVLMGAGSQVTLDLGGPVQIQVQEGALNALIEQGGAIKADGGLVYLTASAVGDLISTVINHSGVTEAQTLATGESGKIYLMGNMRSGRIEVGGTLDASAPNGGDGGFVETSAAQVQLRPDLAVSTRAAHGQTGQWLIDPFDFVVSSSGGNITGEALSALLADNHITIQTANPNPSATSTTLAGTAGANGDIFVNDGVTWSSGNALTLNAWRNIEINAPMNASAGAGGRLVLMYGQGAVADGNTATYTINAPIRLQNSGAPNGTNAGATNFGLRLGSDGAMVNFTVISTHAALTAIGSSLTSRRGNYAVGADVSLVGMAAPIGNNLNAFTGRFDGLGNTLSGLTLNTTGMIGLFAHAGLGATFSNLKLDNFNLTNTESVFTGSNEMGSLAGRAVGARFYNIDYQNVTLSAGTAPATNLDNQIGQGLANVGGLIGVNTGTAVTIDRVSGRNITIQGRRALGGLIGTLDGTSFGVASSVSNVRLDGVTLTITGSSAGVTSDAGGLVGGMGGGHIRASGVSNLSIGTLSDGNVANGGVGGLVGVVNGGRVSESFAQGSIVVNNHTGTLGGNTAFGSVGGLVGRMQANGALIENSYALTNITLNNGNNGTFAGVGGLVGRTHFASGLSGSISNSYAAGVVNTGNLTGVAANTVGGFLGTSLTANTLTLSHVYWDSGVSTRTNGIGTTTTALAAGSTAPVAVTGAAALAQSSYAGFDFNNVWRSYEGISRPVLRVLQAPVQVRVHSASKVYDRVAWSGGTFDARLGASVTGSVVLGGTAQGAIDAGSYTIEASGLTQTRTTHLDYQNWGDLTYLNGTLSISPRPITVQALDQSKVYGEADPALAWQLVAGNMVGSDTLSGALTRAAGENVGSYTIDASALANGNYLITVQNGQLSISPRPITVQALDQSKVYGEADPALAWQLVAGNMVGSDTLSGALTRAAGENVGSYTIDASALANGNYLITVQNGQLSISPRPIIITANPKTKTIGQADPDLTFGLEPKSPGRGLVTGDIFSDNLTRDSGEQAGDFAIHQGTVGNPNYLIEFIGANLTITPPPPAPTPELPPLQNAATNAQQSATLLAAGEPAAGALPGLSPAVAPSAFFMPPTDAPTVDMTPTSVTVSGGLQLVATEQEPVAAGDGIIQGSETERDLAGFMRVFVVRGGINVPDGWLAEEERN